VEKYFEHIFAQSYDMLVKSDSDRRDNTIFIKLVRKTIDDIRKEKILKETSSTQQSSFFSRILG